ncbi:beta-galactosidase [Paenibacillus cellulosilyticus]|uniref:Beta-galactosidase n=1 Tax=Paenibacillus cellulosilyticus TaxID=375489 RepID=A0A2V2YR46_9BACL|nr:beta-galactosidase [Paenibacillus cellulosilyticus]PWV99536.1 beta-galactosidase [Paenibacillus cellulosilyticus]QKS44785.1 beta-galactosidase [Paenibacillus cellulosilyticus]
MINSVNMEPVVQWTPNSVSIQGKSVILFSASLFYFRIPRELWRERLSQVKAYGYNCIDVYFPWNYHELREGEWDFSGQRNVEEFLEAARDEGLWVIARPGPYICSEWDGGALPAYLLAKDDMKIRQNDPAFLKQVSRWFDQIMPLLSRFQLGIDGTIIAVQLDNELDFFDCKDPQGYMAAMRDMSLAAGVTVPLIACAGQGGLIEATGLTEGVVPTCNFYPNDRDPIFEQKVHSFRSTLAGMGYPLLVTETNRSHYLLRRLLSAGAKLLGPYLQVSGTDFGFTNATNNWGRPLAFMTSDYDFGGMISPEGIVRGEAYEGRLLTRVIGTYGESIAQAEAVIESDWELADEPTQVFGPQELKLHDGGSLLFVTNGENAAKRIQLRYRNNEASAALNPLSLSSGRSIIIPVDLPLERWGIEGKIVFAGAELFHAETNEQKTVLLFHQDAESEIVLELEGCTIDKKLQAEVVLDQDRLHLKLKPTEQEDAQVFITLTDGRQLILVQTTLLKALYMRQYTFEGGLVIEQPAASPLEGEPVIGQQWQLAQFDPAISMVADENAGAIVRMKGAIDYLEKVGIYRGFAWYEGHVAMTKQRNSQGLLIRQGSDIVSLYADGEYAGTAVPAGSSWYIPFASPKSVSAITAKAEIWGHSNFDDARLPGLRLHSLKGLQGIAAVLRAVDITQNWRVHRLQDRSFEQQWAEPFDDSLWPMAGFGGWMSPDNPVREVYRRTHTTDADANRFIVHLDGFQGKAVWFVNGRVAGELHAYDPFLDITSLVKPGEQLQLTVLLEHPLGARTGKVNVYEAVDADSWTISGAEEGLLIHAQSHRDAAVTVQLPLSLNSGDAAWLYGTIANSQNGRGWRVRVDGQSLKMTVFHNETIVSRLWLKGGTQRPVLTGGDASSIYLPGPWFGDDGAEISILLEAVDRQEQGQLKALQFIAL